MSYKEFQNKWLGKRVDIDKVYGYQCADLVKQYMFETKGVPNGAYGNAIDYWYRPHKNVLAKYVRVNGSKAVQGDIVVLKGVNGNPYGHIGIADGSAGLLTIPLLEQNGSTGNGSGLGGDAIRVRNIPRWRVVGLLRSKATSVPVYHIVKSGDTMTAIAKKYGTTLSKLASLNPTIKDLNKISVGQKVRVK